MFKKAENMESENEGGREETVVVKKPKSLSFSISSILESKGQDEDAKSKAPKGVKLLDVEDIAEGEEDDDEEEDDRRSEEEEEEEVEKSPLGRPVIKVPAQRPTSGLLSPSSEGLPSQQALVAAAAAASSAHPPPQLDLTPWMYRPLPLPGGYHLPIPPNVLASKFAGKPFYSHCGINGLLNSKVLDLVLNRVEDLGFRLSTHKIRRVPEPN